MVTVKDLQDVVDELKGQASKRANDLLGEGTKRANGLAFDSKGHLYVLSRGTQPLTEFDENGKFIRAFGEGLFTRSHGIRDRRRMPHCSCGRNVPNTECRP